MAKRVKDVITGKKTPRRVSRVEVEPPRVGNGSGNGAVNGAKSGAQPIGAAEKLLLGLTPNDTVVTVPRALRGLVRGDGTSARLDALQAFLTRNPEVRVELEREAEAMWARAGGKRDVFAAAVTERRAQLLTQAQLSMVSEMAPASVDAGYRELARYLAEMYGISG